MAGIPLASAFVRVRPDVDKREFEKDGQKAGEAAGKAYGDGFYKDSAGKLRDANGKFVKASAQAGAEAGEQAGQTFGDGFYKDAAGRLRRANGQFATQAEKAALGSGEKSGESFGKAFKKSASKAGGDGDSVFGKVAKIAASRIALIGVAAAAATPGVLHLTAALLPAAGAMVALPAIFGAVQLASVTLKIALGGVGEAIGAGLQGDAKKTEKALEKLPPVTQAFARSIIVLRPQIEKLKNAVSGRFLLPLTNEVKPLAAIYFPLLTKNMSNLAGPLGGLGEQLAQTARKAQVFGAVNKLFAGTRLAVINVRGAIDPLLKALGATISATSSILPQLATNITNVANRFGKWVQAAAGSGAIMRTFQAGAQVLRDLTGILGNVLSIFGSVLKAASAGSQTLLGNFRALTGQAAAFLKSAEGIGGLAATFAVFDQLGSALRTSLGAVLPALAESLQTLGPAIGALAGPASTIIVAIAPLLPLLAGIAATVLVQLTPAITAFANFLAENNGVVTAAVAAFTAWSVALRISAALIAVNLAGGLVAYLKGTQLVIAATRIWTGVQIAFQAVMALSPFTLVTLAIIALVAAIVIAYKNSETFRNIVQAVWGAIKTAIKATVDWITGTAVPFILRAWDGIKAGALFLWHNVIEPVWNGIKAVIGVVINIVKGYIGLLVAEFKVIAGVALFLWHNIFSPVFNAIGKIVEIWWLAVEIVFKAFYNVIRATIISAINTAKAVFSAVFGFIQRNVIAPWWNTVKAIFSLFMTFVVGPFVAALTTVKNFFVRIFNAIISTIRNWYNGHIVPVFALVRKAWELVSIGFSLVYNNKIKPIFAAFISFIREKVVGGFQTGVAAIKAAWDKVREYARVPVAFVVNKIINPFIGGLNKAAAIVGVKDRVEPIKGFASGGQIPGYATGGRITGPGSSVDNRLAPARIPGVGAVKLAGGEYVVNAQDTAKALPLLKWINSGMRGGASGAADRIGRPMTRYPGDGSEGYAFAGGGLVGWANDVWGAISDPVGTLKKPFDAALANIPGAGNIKNFLVAAAKKVIGGAVNWLKGFGGFGDGTFAYHGPKGGRIGAAAAFVKGQEGKPYIWNDAGPAGYDCSGIVSAAYNILKGRDTYSHTFSTGSLPGGFFKPGTAGPLVAGWSHPGQSPASASVGHMAGNIGGLAFESRGSKGVVVGSHARGVNQFANLGYAALAGGGLLGNGVRVFDSGGPWPSGTFGLNTSGRTEYVDPNRDGSRGGGGDTFNFHEGAFAGAIMASGQQAEDLVVSAIKSAKRKRRLS